MKILDISQSGKCGTYVSYRSRFGACRRQHIVPANTQTEARQRMRRAFGGYSRAWGGLLTQEQREAWNVAGPKVQSRKRLGQSGPLTGQQHFQGISSARACIGRGMLLLPPEPVVFGPNPVGQLTITNGDHGVRLLLKVSGPVTEDIMVFGQAPCSRGRTKRRNVSYLGLLPAPQNGLSDITDQYIARYGEPPPRQRIFIVTVQQQNGWESDEQETNAVVPDKPEGQQAAAASALSLIPHMHKGCTRDAQGGGAPVVPECTQGDKGETQRGEAGMAGSGAAEPAQGPQSGTVGEGKRQTAERTCAGDAALQEGDSEGAGTEGPASKGV
jgi:hypothetical protein